MGKINLKEGAKAFVNTFRRNANLVASDSALKISKGLEKFGNNLENRVSEKSNKLLEGVKNMAYRGADKAENARHYFYERSNNIPVNEAKAPPNEPKPGKPGGGGPNEPNEPNNGGGGGPNEPNEPSAGGGDNNNYNIEHSTEVVRESADELGRRYNSEYDAIKQEYRNKMNAGNKEMADIFLDQTVEWNGIASGAMSGLVGAGIGGVAGGIADYASDGELDGGGVALGMLGGAGIGGLLGYRHGVKTGKKSVAAMLLSDSLENGEINENLLKRNNIGIELGEGEQLGNIAININDENKIIRNNSKIGFGKDNKYYDDVTNLLGEFENGTHDSIAKEISERLYSDQGGLNQSNS